MRHIGNGALVLCVAMLALGCASQKADRQDITQQDVAKKNVKKEADESRVKRPTVPSSIFQGYDVTGSRF